jgi:hypothetical protein
MAQSLNSVIFKSHFWNLVVILAAFTPFCSWAQSASANITASATVLQTLTITNATPLSFGNFVAGAGGTVTIPVITPNTRTFIANATNSTPLTLVASGAGAVSNITVTGVQGTYTVAVGPTAELAFGNIKMSVTNITTSLGASSGLIPSSGGSQTFQVGGTLNVNANQAPGNYSGSIPITVAYQ